MPIRQLMLKAAPVVQALKPVMMMSPLSVAQFLSPGHMTFDLLVMDEASQIQPVDALGAIARCRQIVVVGDERQLPPTKFFSKMINDAAEVDENDETGAQVGDVESVLGLCLARGLPQRMLRWHYRSRHQSLIAVSNSQFYENKLLIIPSPYTQEAGTGLRFISVPNGVFESGSSGANSVEAKAVAEAVIRHALDHPEHSLGVATFSVRQRKAIQDHLELMRRMNPLAETFFSGHPSEPFFIKNLENVQGDERDVIFISVGYGRNENGFFAMRFGPLGSDGGERRLNVLISRAKRRCDVFASITDEDIDTDRAKGRGVVAFKLFLHYARTGHLQMGHFVSEDPALSVMGDQVERVIQAEGYQVHRHVGLSGLFIDLAVADPERPGRYILGIELDGPSYANAQSARDRDRLRNAVLRDHGWELHRIWAMDWLQRPTEQARLLLHAIEEARKTLRSDELEKRDVAVPVEIVAIERGEVTEMSLKSLTESATNFYKEATLTDVPMHQDFASASPALLSKYVQQIVAVEGPVHRDEVVVRLRSAWHLLRSGGRIQAAVDEAIRKAISDGLVAGGDFLYIEGQKSAPRDRSTVASPGLRRVEMLPPTEVDAGILTVIQTSMGGTTEQVIQAVSRMLGFKSTSSQLRDVIRGRQQSLITAGRLAETDGMLHHPC
jgi:very-short-patch-repair endonuclease